MRTTDSRHGHAVAENVLDRHFEPGEPDRTWVDDITYIATGEGWLYLAALLDLGSRKVVGWATADNLLADVVVRALGYAWEHRRPVGPRLHHSNAVMESLFETLKQELVHRREYLTREEARVSLFDYIEVFYNRVRLHSTLGYLSPVQYEVSRKLPQVSAH